MNNSSSTEKTKAAKVKTSAPTSTPPVDTEEIVEATPVATQKGLSGSQKKSLAGVAAGVLALGAIFYVATNNKTDESSESLAIENNFGAAQEDKADAAAKDFVKRYIGPVPYPAPQTLPNTDDASDE